MKSNNENNAQMGILGNRSRFLSFNTPLLSPMNMVQSPFMNMGDSTLFNPEMNPNHDFRLEQNFLAEENVESICESEDAQIEELSFAKLIDDEQITRQNLIAFLVDTINLEQDRISKTKEYFQITYDKFDNEVFSYLYRRFKKAKKTKEQMIKYTMRKSFKFITDQMKKDDPSLCQVLSTDGIQGMSIYFNKYTLNSQISIPFKKNSVEKTMNTAFLKKVFTCRQFSKDYRRFLKTFQQDFLKDNNKKVSSMSDAVKLCLSTKSFKSLENFKRIPWTRQILLKLRTFAQQLLNFSPYKGGNGGGQIEVSCQQQRDSSMKCHNISSIDPIHKLSEDQIKLDPGKRLNSDTNELHLEMLADLKQNQSEDDDIMETLPKKTYMKKSVIIILTPPMKAAECPVGLGECDNEPLE